MKITMDGLNFKHIGASLKKACAPRGFCRNQALEYIQLVAVRGEDVTATACDGHSMLEVAIPCEVHEEGTCLIHPGLFARVKTKKYEPVLIETDQNHVNITSFDGVTIRSPLYQSEYINIEAIKPLDRPNAASIHINADLMAKVLSGMHGIVKLEFEKPLEPICITNYEGNLRQYALVLPVRTASDCGG